MKTRVLETCVPVSSIAAQSLKALLMRLEGTSTRVVFKILYDDMRRHLEILPNSGNHYFPGGLCMMSHHPWSEFHSECP